ncbi:MAG TPA: hypothetical protein PKA64_18105, partial [Myxococcota bacterium]|nr:hypothetical protein [Myxococcota bacterium]
PAPAAAPAAPVDRGLATVTELDRGRPVIDRGTVDGLKVGDFIALYAEQTRRLGSSEMSEFRQLTTGKVVAVAEDAAIVEVGVNQVIPIGARAQKVSKLDSARVLAPPRLGGHGFLRVEGRGLISMARVGGGAYLAASAGYRFKLPITLELRATPLFLGLDNGIGVGKGTVSMIVMFDHHLFAIGLGGGAAFNPGQNLPIFTMRLRLGAEDGLSLTSTLQLAQYPSSDGYAAWGVDLNQADVQIPLTAGRIPTWMLLRGMGGEFGGGGYLGARFRLKGLGEFGTLGITPMIGGEVYTSGSTYLAGPGVGLGFDVVL